MIKPYYEKDGITIFHGDCREILPMLPKVDLILTDPPYGMTALKWDVGVMDWFWESLKSCAKEDAVFIITASQPFTSDLICSNRTDFKTEWIWMKCRGSNFMNLKSQPFKEHESVIVFCSGSFTFSPIKENRTKTGRSRIHDKYSGGIRNKIGVYGDLSHFKAQAKPNELRHPSSIQFFSRDRGLHPTQKPTSLMSYFLRTYGSEGDIVCDPFMGSGTTLRACKDLKINCIGIEIEEKYCEIAVNRLSQNVLDFGGSE